MLCSVYKRADRLTPVTDNSSGSKTGLRGPGMWQYSYVPMFLLPITWNGVDIKGVVHPQNDFLSIDYSCLRHLSSKVFFLYLSHF